MKNTAHRKPRGVPVGLPVFPASLLLGGRSCLVVGGGKVAFRKVSGLLDAEADVTVVSR
jgi:siroheme synthase (precorrin-2 oxidase/ferrochelatase)